MRSGPGDEKMEVILLERIDNLGGVGDKVKVKPGYGRNYLIPQGKATLATAANLAAFEARRAELEAKAEAELAAARERAAAVEKLALTIHTKAGVEGKLFGSIGTMDIADAATAAGVPLERSEVLLPEGPLRIVGEHTVDIHLHTDITVPLTVTVAEEEEEQA
jgi:large subunit ribosomal protein L9